MAAGQLRIGTGYLKIGSAYLRIGAAGGGVLEVCEDWETDLPAVWHADDHGGANGTLYEIDVADGVSPTSSFHAHVVHHEIQDPTIPNLLTTDDGVVTIYRDFVQTGRDIQLHFWMKVDDWTQQNTSVEVSTFGFLWALTTPGRYDFLNTGDITTFKVFDGVTPGGIDTGLLPAGGWNEITLRVDDLTGNYVDITVNGATVDLSAVAGAGAPDVVGDITVDFQMGGTVGGLALGASQTITFDVRLDDICIQPASGGDP